MAVLGVLCIRLRKLAKILLCQLNLPVLQLLFFRFVVISGERVGLQVWVSYQKIVSRWTHEKRRLPDKESPRVLMLTSGQCESQLLYRHMADMACFELPLMLFPTNRQFESLLWKACLCRFWKTSWQSRSFITVISLPSSLLLQNEPGLVEKYAEVCRQRLHEMYVVTDVDVPVVFLVSQCADLPGAISFIALAGNSFDTNSLGFYNQGRGAEDFVNYCFDRLYRHCRIARLGCLINPLCLDVYGDWIDVPEKLQYMRIQLHRFTRIMFPADAGRGALHGLFLSCFPHVEREAFARVLTTTSQLAGQ